MPIYRKKAEKYSPPKDIEISWENFKGGLNVLLKPSELKGNELAQADDLMLTGAGVPTKRWGTSNYFLAGVATTSENVRALFGAYFKDGDNELLAMTDAGLLVKKSGASYAIITGASWASGYNTEMAMLDDWVWICNGVDHLKRYSNPSSGATLAIYSELATPAGVAASNLSGISIAQARGESTWSWRISAESDVGETLASNPISLTSLPQDLSNTCVRVSWTPVSSASGILKGYVIYGRDGGEETYLARVSKDQTYFDDDGSAIPSDIAEPPTANTTGGPIGKYIISYKDKLILAGFDDNPCRVAWTGGSIGGQRFHWSSGGGYLDIDKDSGDVITGLAVHQEKLVVFKERSIWQMTFTTSAGLTVPIYQLITRSHGCSSHRSIRAVENDIFFLSRNGVYALGYEPNIMADVLRTTEISSKIRTWLAGKTPAEFQNSCAIYCDYKYVLSIGDRMMPYDRERLAWMGPWSISSNVTHVYYDSDKNEKWLYGESDGGYVVEMTSAQKSDKGEAFTTLLRTRQEDYGDWTRFKTIKDVYTRFRSVIGDVGVNIRLEERTGTTVTAKSFTISSITGSSGFGTDQFGTLVFGLSNEAAGYAGTDETMKWYSPHKLARTLQVEVTTDAASDSYELLGIKSVARPIGRGFTPGSWRV